MPDNLSVTISADSSKLEVAAQRAKAALSSVTREMTQLRNEAQKTGDWSGVEALAPALAAARTAARSTQTAIRGLGVTANETSLSFTELGKTIGQFAKVSGIAIGGIKALRFGIAGLVGAEVIRGLNAVADRITDISELSKKSGFDPSTIQAFGIALEKTGGKAEDARSALAKLSEIFTEEKANAITGYWNDTKEGIAGAAKAATPAAAALRDLGVNVANIQPGAKGLDQFLFSVAQGLVRLNQQGTAGQTKANADAVILLGQNYRQLGGVLESVVQSGNLDALKAKLNVLTPEQFKQMEAYTQSVKDLSLAWNAFTETLVTLVGPALSGLLKGLTLIVDVTEKAIKALSSIQSLKTPQADMTLAPETAGGFASGGFIRGPGTGTSDSILARLSRGEFVMRARAVDHWGPRFMAALNNLQNPFGHYATGGLVQLRSAQRFATGGMVSARTSDGATVHLHLSTGGHYQLKGDKEVVASLTREARRAGMLSAGRMPGALA